MPKLVAIDGPARGSVYPLDAPEVFIGRSSTNDIAIADVSLSRRHSAIRREGDVFRVCDLESQNGTNVNGTPVSERVLRHGDAIAVGDTVLLFLAGDEETEGEHLDTSVSVGETIHLRREEAFYDEPERFAESGAPPERLARELHSLLEIGKLIASVKTMEALARRLLELVLDAAPAERAAVLFLDDGEDGISTFYGRDRRSSADAHFTLSSSVVSRVIGEGTAILSNDVRHSADLAAAASLRGPGVKALLAVPILQGDRVLGVIYLDSSGADAAFDTGHLQFMSAISGMAALALESVRRMEMLADENRRLHDEAGLEHHMVGESPALRETIRLIGRVAPTDSTVLILGESGTGKELAARAIHENSPRAQKPFVGINCAALTETLLESELFGHEKGAFTGAFAQKRGKLEVADGGTLFLDEIGELAPMLQAKLLRVLQEREFERVGGTRPIQVDVRIIAATNRDLAALARSNTFRADLYYRLNVVSLKMPALRERREDIPMLANYFVQKCSRRSSTRRVRGISPKARTLLQRYDWPGNIRELENAIERAVVLGMSETIEPEDLPEALLETAPGVESLDEYHEAVNEARRQIVLRALEKTSGNFTRAARLLGIQPTYLHRLARNLNLKADSKATGEDA
jgi:Nif-specific regulatory protein